MKDHLQKCLLDQVYFGQDLLDTISAHFKPVLLQAGNLFSEPDRVCSKMAFISNGALRMYNIADGIEVTLWIGTENRFITDLRSFVQQTPSRWYIEAVTDCRLGVISRENHFKLLENYPEWLEFDNRLLTSAFSIMEHKLYSQLYMTAEERFKELMNHEPGLFNRVPHKHIASMLGMAPETLSRLRGKQIS